MAPLRVLLVGPGRMGLSHGLAYARLDGFEPAGICARSILNRTDLPKPWSALPRFTDFHVALAETRPDVVSINTFPDTHAEFAIKALNAGAHAHADELIASADEPDHDALCQREQAFLLRAIRQDLDLSDHMQDAVSSLRIVLAADTSIRERRVVEL
jgi:hypothetical protein